MLIIQIPFKCVFPDCGCEDFYTMPAEEPCGKDDVKASPNNYFLRCKKCKQKYLLHYELKVL